MAIVLEVSDVWNLSFAVLGISSVFFAFRAVARSASEPPEPPELP